MLKVTGALITDAIFSLAQRAGSLFKIRLSTIAANLKLFEYRQ
jgi:hypothetical protein